MKNRIWALSLSLFLLIPAAALAQAAATAQATAGTTTKLFQTEAPLPIRISYSDKNIKKETNDSTYIDQVIDYQDANGDWASLNLQIRARGNWRQENCFLTPVKFKIPKESRENTLFEGNKELKMVLPCKDNDQGQDWVLKEYLAYKLYEVISPYHFKTRRLAIDFTDTRGNKEKQYQLEGFVIEDISNVADRCSAKRMKRNVHPQQQDDICCTQNDFFQYMIGNTDYSVAYQHNEKLIFVEGTNATVPVPYDFDMSGLVDASYAVVSQIGDEVLPNTDVTQRVWRGFVRNPGVYEQVRQQYLSKEAEMMSVVDGLKSSFRSEKEFEKARNYIKDFFNTLKDPGKFNREIVAAARTK